MSARSEVGTLSLPQLLECDNEEFVRAAYIALFERDADADGLAFYALELLRGADKLEILERLSSSDEARRRGPTGINGLPEALSHRRKQQGLGWRALRHLSGAQSEALARRVRGIEQTVRRSAQRIDANSAEARSAAAEMMSQIFLIAELIGSGPAEGHAPSEAPRQGAPGQGPAAHLMQAQKVARMKTFLGDV